MAWYAASYTEGDRGGGYGHAPSLSCRLSAAAIGFLAVLFPPRVSAFLTVGLPAAGLLRWTVTGFPCSALVRCGRCRAPPLPRDRGALMADAGTSATTAASQRRVLFFAVASHLPKFWITRLAEIHVIRPSGLSLACDRGWGTGPWASSRASHPAVASDACQERERALSTRPELTVNHVDPPFRLSHSHSATSRRTPALQ
jgi:hypothetical protein